MIYISKSWHRHKCRPRLACPSQLCCSALWQKAPTALEHQRQALLQQSLAGEGPCSLSAGSEPVQVTQTGWSSMGSPGKPIADFDRGPGPTSLRLLPLPAPPSPFANPACTRLAPKVRSNYWARRFNTFLSGYGLCTIRDTGFQSQDFFIFFCFFISTSSMKLCCVVMSFQFAEPMSTNWNEQASYSLGRPAIQECHLVLDVKC